MGGKYDDYDWKELPKDVKKAAELLGFDKQMWDADREPAACDKYWKDLAEAEKLAAVVLGYNEGMWNAESDSDSD